jgi:hypothetical protein
MTGGLSEIIGVVLHGCCQQQEGTLEVMFQFGYEIQNKTDNGGSGSERLSKGLDVHNSLPSSMMHNT